MNKKQETQEREEVQEDTVITEETTTEEVTVKLIQVNSTVSVARKIPLETYGSIDFFSSQGSILAVNHPEDMPIKKVFDEYVVPARDQLVRLNMRKAMEDVSYQILVVRAIRDGLSPSEATTMAREQIEKLTTTLKVLAKGAQ
jgi:hypothetical protein